MQTSETAIKQIARYEGSRNSAYKDSEGLWTIGVGHLIRNDELDLIKKHLTDDEVLALFKRDLAVREVLLNSIIHNMSASVAKKWNMDNPIMPSQQQYDAMMSFLYNAGQGNLQSSTWFQLFFQGKLLEASDSLAQWGSKQWKTSPGLKIRRQWEANMLLKQEETHAGT